MLIPQQPIPAHDAQGVPQIGTFGFLQDRQMFDLLSNQLYTRKAEAAVREPSCNAMDAHIAAGKPEQPIEIWAPTRDNPVFRVRDYGEGMSYQMLVTNYPTYGWSDKRQDEISTGGFGLGAKSPLAYLNNFEDGVPRPFTVCSVHQGERNVILCALNERGTPGIHEVIRGEKTTDRSGVEVSFEVSPEHVDVFRKVIQYVFLAFEVQPIVHDLQLLPRNCLAQAGNLSIVDYGEDNTDYRTGPSLTLANVTYPVRNLTPKNPLINDWLSPCINLRVATGPRIMAPSREALMETRPAKDFLEAQYESAIANAYKAAYAVMSKEMKEHRDSSYGMAMARKALMEAKLSGFPYKAAGFARYLGLEDVDAQCYEVITKSTALRLALPSFMREIETGLSLYYYLPSTQEAAPGTLKRLSPYASYEKKEKRAGSRSSTAQLVEFSFFIMGGVSKKIFQPEIVLLESSSSVRRFRSEVLRRLRAGQENTSYLGIKVTAKLKDKALALLSQLKSEPGYSDLIISRADAWELDPVYTLDSDKKKRETGPKAAPRLREQFMYIPAMSSSSWSLARVALGDGDALLSSGTVGYWVNAPKASWRRGNVTKYEIQEHVSHVAAPGGEANFSLYSENSTSMQETRNFLQELTTKMPAGLLVTNAKKQALVKELGIPSFGEYVLSLLQKEILTFAPEVRRLAALLAAREISTEYGFSADEFRWLSVTAEGSQAFKELAAAITDSHNKRALKGTLPELFKKGVEYTKDDVVRCRTIMLRYNRFLRRVVRSCPYIYDGHKQHLVYDLLSGLSPFAKQVPHLNIALKSFSEAGGHRKAAFLMAMNFRYPEELLAA